MSEGKSSENKMAESIEDEKAEEKARNRKKAIGGLAILLIVIVWALFNVFFVMR